MATENNYNPTFANILSSLRIKGASITGGTGKEGFVPVLKEDGTLDVSVIPVEELNSSLAVPVFEGVAFVNSNDTRSGTRDGSIALPYKKLEYAPTSFHNFILASGNYGTDKLEIVNTGGSLVRIVGIGDVNFSSLTFQGYSEGTVFELYNVVVTGTLTFEENVTTSTLTLDGTSLINAVNIPNEDSVAHVRLGANCKINGFSGNGEHDVEYLASTNRIANNSTVVSGDTVTIVIDKLGSRKIEIPIFTADSHGLHVDSSDYELVTADSDRNVYSIVALGQTIADAINETFHKDGDSPYYNDVTAENITANAISTTEITTNVINLGISSESNAILKIDSDKFLVIA